MKKNTIVSVSLFTLSFILLSCSTTPTGRSQFALMPEKQMASMGSQSFEQLKRKTPTETDPKINAYIRCITDPIIKVAGPVEGVSRWEVVVFRDNSANAFALPGGKIGVHTGIIKVAKTPDQLAAVLGHEVGHVMAKHGNERVSQNLATQGILLGATAALLGTNKKMDLKTKAILGGLGIGAQFGILLPFSRAHESEADIIGLELMAKAGFNPSESVELWKNMGVASGGKQPPQFMSTHPSHETRINNLSKNIPRVNPLYQRTVDEGRSPRCVL